MLVLTVDDKNKVIITGNNGEEMILMFNRKKAVTRSLSGSKNPRVSGTSTLPARSGQHSLRGIIKALRGKSKS